MDILTFIDKVNQNFDKQPEPRYNTKKYFMGGSVTTPKRGLVDEPGSYAGDKPQGYINLTELGEIVGLPERIATHPKTGKKRALGGLRQRILDTLARKPSKERRNLKSKDFAEKFLIKELDLKQIDLGQGQQTFIIKKPKKTELKNC